jgi:predicted ATPase/DNA-binding XRE family transcriptional regulator
MPDTGKVVSALPLETFGDLLKYLRRRAQLTQRELAIAVGYSEAHVSRLEKNQRLPDLATLAALFIPALGLENEPELVKRLLELATGARGQSLPASGKFTVTQTISEEKTETVETIEIPSNLPLQLTSFIGRETEIAEIKELLQKDSDIRFLTLIGAGGCGKTRLAVQVTEQIVSYYPHGVWFIDLTPLNNADLIPRTIASLLGVPEIQTQETIRDLLAFLRTKKMLLLFDNCEHLLDGLSHLVEAIIRFCPQVQILVTTREILNIPGEKLFHVSPLPYPDETVLEKKAIGEFASVRLFIQRAQNVQPSFTLTDENAAYIARICRRLDGIPLAIELAAARVNLLRVQQIDAQLNDRFHLLTSGSRTLPRHQTLRAMIDWGHDLLSEVERSLFHRLSVFAGGWTLESANAVTEEASHTTTLDLLSRLVDKSFINAEREPESEARYSMLETLREYAVGQLEATHETERTRERHFEYFYELTQQARLYGNDKGYWLDKLETEHDNIRAALNWSFRNRQIEKATRLVLAILDFYWFRGFTVEGREWMDKFIAMAVPASPLRALLLQKAGWFARGGGDFKKADMLLQRAIEMARAIGDATRTAMALLDLGLSARDQGNHERGISCFSEALALAQDSGDSQSMGNCYYYLAESYGHDFDTSISFWEQGLALARQAGDQTRIAWGLEGLAGTTFLKRDFVTALEYHLESLRIKVQVMDKLGIAYSFEGLAQVAAAEEEPERATVLWGAASQLREAMQVPSDPSRARIYVSLIPSAREQLGEEVFKKAWKRGQTMKLDEAITYALDA